MYLFYIIGKNVYPWKTKRKINLSADWNLKLKSSDQILSLSAPNMGCYYGDDLV